MANIDYYETVSIQRSSDSTVQQIRNLIRSGRLKPGDQLPGQRELCKLLGIGRSSLREAYRTLQALGVLESVPGKGTFVRAPSLAHFGSSLSLWLSEHQDQVLEILEVRSAIESKTIELAALRASEAHISALEACLADMTVAVNSGSSAELASLDAQFHELIGQAAQNDLLLKLSDSLADVILPSRTAIFELAGRPLRSLEEHQRMLRAIKRHQAGAAVDAMIEHLKGVAQEVEAFAAQDAVEEKA